MVKRIVVLVAVLWAPFALAQYPHTLTPKSFDITSYCTTGTNCWNNAGSTIIAPVSGSMGKDTYNLWVRTDGSLQHYNFSTKAMEAVTMQYPNTKQITVVDKGTIYRLAITDPGCATGMNYMPQQWNWHTQAWVNMPVNGSCKVWIAAGQDGSLYSAVLGNALGNIVQKWNGTAWAAFGTTNLLTLSVADSSHACGMSKISGTAKIYTQSGSNFVVMAIQPPGTPMGCSMGKAYADANYMLVAWNTAQQASVYDWATSTWKTISGLTTVSNSNAMVARSKGLTFAIGADGRVHHYNVMAQGYTANITGSWTGCPINPCPPSGVTHNGKVQVTVPSGLAGPLVTANLPPSTNMNISSSDFAPGCDSFAGQPGVVCMPTVTQQVICSASGQNLTGGGDSGCIEDFEDSAGTWNFGSTVTVYFDGSFFPATTCPPNMNSDACNVYVGISNWDTNISFLTRIVHYTFGGVIVVGDCSMDTPDRVVYIPCNPHYPFLMVTGQPEPGAYSGPITTDPGGQRSYMFVGLDVLDGPQPEQKTIGAHEEGHHHGLGNCDPQGVPPTCAGMTPTDTVMWHEYDSTQPWSPTECDRLWADFYESLL